MCDMGKAKKMKMSRAPRNVPLDDQINQVRKRTGTRAPAG